MTLNKAITLAGVDTSAKINPTSGSGITVSHNGATIQNLVVYGATGNGISATGLNGLTLTGVVSRGNTGSGAQLTNDTSVTVTNGNYSWNTNQGFNATNGSSYSLSGVIANNNGTTAPQGSGINITNITASSGSPSTVTNCTANNNHYHGLTVGDGSTYLTISGGTYNGNGTGGNAHTGGGINIIAENTTTTSNITVQGSVTSSNNTTAGIFIFSDNATVNAINTVTIGATGSITCKRQWQHQRYLHWRCRRIGLRDSVRCPYLEYHIHPRRNSWRRTLKPRRGPRQFTNGHDGFEQYVYRLYECLSCSILNNQCNSAPYFFQ